MQIKVDELTKSEVFRPFELRIVVESKKELEILYNQFNMCYKDVYEDDDPTFKGISAKEYHEITMPIFTIFYARIENKYQVWHRLSAE